MLPDLASAGDRALSAELQPPPTLITESDLLQGSMVWVAAPANVLEDAVPPRSKVYVWPQRHGSAAVEAGWRPCLAWSYPHERVLVSLRTKPLPVSGADLGQSMALRLCVFDEVRSRERLFAALVTSAPQQQQRVCAMKLFSPFLVHRRSERMCQSARSAWTRKRPWKRPWPTPVAERLWCVRAARVSALSLSRTASFSLHGRPPSCIRSNLIAMFRAPPAAVLQRRRAPGRNTAQRCRRPLAATEGCIGRRVHLPQAG